MTLASHRCVRLRALGLAAAAVLAATCMALFNRAEKSAEVRARNRFQAQQSAMNRLGPAENAVSGVPAHPAVMGAAQRPTPDVRPGPAPPARAPSPPRPASAHPPAARPQGQAPSHVGQLPLFAMARDALPKVRYTNPWEPAPSALDPGAPAFEFNRIAPSSDSAWPAPPVADLVPEANSEAPEHPDQDGRRSPGHAGYMAFAGGEESSADEPESSAPDPEPASGQSTTSGGGSNPPPGPPQPAPVPRISLFPSSATVETGQTVQVVVRVDGGQDISSVPFHLQHDGKVLQFERVQAGDFLARDGSAPVVMAAPVQGTNEVAVGITKTGTGPGISGSGTLLTLEFRVMSAGTTPLMFVQEQLLNSQHREIPAQFVSSQVSGR